MEDIKLVYTSQAWCPIGISLNKVYGLGKEDDKSFISNNGENFYFDYEVIQMMFTPQGKTWQEIDNPTSPTKITKE